MSNHKSPVVDGSGWSWETWLHSHPAPLFFDRLSYTIVCVLLPCWIYTLVDIMIEGVKYMFADPHQNSIIPSLQTSVSILLGLKAAALVVLVGTSFGFYMARLFFLSMQRASASASEWWNPQGLHWDLMTSSQVTSIVFVTIGLLIMALAHSTLSE
jgi:hypothetical protein